MKAHQITLERTLELLDYNPETGAFVWRQSQGKSRSGKPAGTVQAGYLKMTLDREQIRANRLAWFMSNGQWPTGQIDHINGIKLDNRIANLRDVEQSVNMQNRYSIKRKDSGLPYGVTRNPAGRFIANIRIGVFDSAEEACAAFMNAKRLIHGGCTR